MGRGAAGSTAAVRGAGGVAVLGRVPSGQRQVAQAELCQDLECHPARLRRTPAACQPSCRQRCVPSNVVGHRIFTLAALSGTH